MEVRPCTVSCAPNGRDLGAGSDLLAGLYQDLTRMCVERLNIIAMVDNYRFSVAAPLTRKDDLARTRCQNWRSGLCCNIEARVHPSRVFVMQPPHPKIT